MKEGRKEEKRNTALHAAMKAAGYNQTTLADAAGLSAACISKLIGGGSGTAQRPTVEKVCAALGMSAGDLKLGARFWRGPVFTPRPVQQELAEGFPTLPTGNMVGDEPAWKPQYWCEETQEWVDLCRSLSLALAAEEAERSHGEGERVRILHRHTRLAIVYGTTTGKAVRCG